MKKIYLAISEKDSKEINDLIITLVPGISIVILNSKIEVMEAIKAPFLLCVTTADFLDLKEIERIELNGKLIIIDSTSLIVPNNKNVKVCNSTNDTIMEIRLSGLSNFNFVFDKSGSIPVKEKKDSVDKKEPEEQITKVVEENHENVVTPKKEVDVDKAMQPSSILDNTKQNKTTIGNADIELQKIGRAHV